MDFLSHENWTSPEHCFCQLPSEELKKWAAKRFCEHISTMDLLSSTDDSAEREMISAVALLDVDQETMLKMMGDVDMPEHHIIHCLENLRDTIDAQCRE
jgi:hypothetical protein